jgi:hypothetical protein
MDLAASWAGDLGVPFRYLFFVVFGHPFQESCKRRTAVLAEFVSVLLGHFCSLSVDDGRRPHQNYTLDDFSTSVRAPRYAGSMSAMFRQRFEWNGPSTRFRMDTTYFDIPGIIEYHITPREQVLH